MKLSKAVPWWRSLSEYRKMFSLCISSPEELGATRLAAMQTFLNDYETGNRELCCVAKEVRIYPLLSLDNKQSMHLNPVRSALADNAIDTSLVPVAYEFQKGSTKMLVAISK